MILPATQGGNSAAASMEGSSPHIRVKMKEVGITFPRYESAGAAGMDLKAWVSQDLTIAPMGRAKIPTGLFVEIPPGYEAQVRPRSGLAARWGVTVLNAPGTVDSDFRGELEVILINFGEEPFIVRNGDRIAQMVISPVARAVMSGADTLSTTERGTKGFGSTGV